MTLLFLLTHSSNFFYLQFIYSYTLVVRFKVYSSFNQFYASTEKVWTGETFAIFLTCTPVADSFFTYIYAYTKRAL